MKITSVKKKDVFLVTVPIGSMPPVKAQGYMNKIKDMFKETFDNDILIVPVREPSEYSFEILRKE